MYRVPGKVVYHVPIPSSMYRAFHEPGNYGATYYYKVRIIFATCQHCKHEQVTYPSLLQPLAIPKQAWEGISMDFVAGPPKSKEKDVILVVVDK